VHILLIEDNPGDALLIKQMLTAKTLHSRNPFLFEITHAVCLQDGLNLLSTQPFDLVFIDLSLPDSHGLATVTKICMAAPQLPVIVLSGDTDEELAIAAVQAGAQDYLLKDQVDSHTITRAIGYALERKKIDLQLKQMAYFDHVTGLANHTQLTVVLNHILKRAQRYKDSVAILFIDLDHFKLVNDTFGHGVGDILLKKIADRLQLSIRSSDIVARIGGDEFVIVLDQCQISDAEQFTNKLMKSINEPILIHKHELMVQASIGISFFPKHGHDVLTLLKAADAAMYRAKELGRNNYQL